MSKASFYHLLYVEILSDGARWVRVAFFGRCRAEGLGFRV